MILIDTSIWIDHFRHGDDELRRIIADDSLLMHKAIIGELALGNLRDRHTVLALLAEQRQAEVATHDEVMDMIETHELFGMGIGYVDAHLLASVLLDPQTRLWSRDKRLSAAARKAGALIHTPL